MKDEYDLVIIGRGAAAFSAAIRASELTSGQASIAMIGFGSLGGTCVNVGCVPSKYLIEASRVAFEQRNPRYPGIPPSTPRIGFHDLMKSLREVIKGERSSKYDAVIKQYENIDVFDGRAAFINEKEVSVEGDAEKRRVKGYNFLIATGSSTAVPNIDGLKEAGYITSDDIWNIDELPARLAVVGGGVIGVELGQALSRLGSHVQIIEALPSILPQLDQEFSAAMTGMLQADGVGLMTRARISGVTNRSGDVTIELLTAEGRREIEVDSILVATGRIPNVSGLNLEAAGVEYSKRGIKPGPTMVTTNPRIYAAGDVVDQGLMLETLAAREGVIAATNMYEHLDQRIDIGITPWAIFTEPQFASVGFTEKEYVKANGGCACRTLKLESVPKARILRETEGIFKLVVDQGTERIVGVHALSPFAAELIMEGVYAIRYHLTVKDIIDSSHIFPTISEGVKLTAQSFTRDISKMSCCME